MRRESDISEGKRTGVGRRERDKILAGEVSPLPGSVEHDAWRARQQNRMLFVADELRESALAAAGIESFLVEVHKALARDDVTAADLAALLDGTDLDGSVQALDDSLCALRRSIQSVIGASALPVNKA